MMNSTNSPVRDRLSYLNEQLARINQEWHRQNYTSLLQFHVDALPTLMNAQRCGIFLLDPDAKRVFSKAGTGIREGEIEVPMDHSIAGRCIRTGASIIVNDTRNHPDFHAETDDHTGFRTRNLLCSPIVSSTDRGVCGAVEVLNKHQGDFDEADQAKMERIAEVLSIVLDNVLLNEQIVAVTNRLSSEVDKVWSGYLSDFTLVAESPAMRNLMEMIKAVSATPVDIHLRGEHGVGKEVIARMIHAASDRHEQPFVAVNCAAIPPHLFESEFFGYEAGAFNGTTGARPGHLESTRGGLLFLDEVGSLNPASQELLLRGLEAMKGYRLGGKALTQYDFRLISASHDNLRGLVDEGRFREDLYYRLFAVEIEVPPLRRRREDIAPLAHSLVAEFARRFDKPVAGFAPETLGRFERYHWPGNVRQLRQEIERMVALVPPGEVIQPHLCSEELLAGTADIRVPPLEDQSDLSLPNRVAELEIRLLKRAIKEARGNKVRAAHLLGITRQGLYKKLKRYHLEEALETR